jgi:hypothetical protein
LVRQSNGPTVERGGMVKDEMNGKGVRVVLAANTSWYVYNFRFSLIKALWARGFAVGFVAIKYVLHCEFNLLFVQVIIFLNI